MRSALYVGHVMHARRERARHSFRYRVYYHLLDLDELHELDAGSRLWGYNRWRPVTFRDRDHLGDPAAPVRRNVERFLAERGLAGPWGRIELLTQCRVFGYVFNPVSFFYVHGSDGALAAIVAEVHNTYGERHCYLLPASDAAGNLWRQKKVFHVSPFMTLEGTYEFRLGPPGEALDIGIDLARGREHLFTSRLHLARRPFSDRVLATLMLRYPLMPVTITTAIHRQALALWRKGVPWRPKPPYDPDAARGGVG